MAAQIGQSTRSQRFIKVYLLTWAIVAVGALGYLATLALQPPAGPARPQIADPEPSQSIRALARIQDDVGRLRPEIGAVRSRMNDLQNDVGQLKETMAEHGARERSIQSRVSAIEERLTTADASQAPPAPTAKGKPVDKTAEKGSQKASEPRAIARVATVSPSETVRMVEASPVRLETGSIAPPEPITFGEAIVTTTAPQAIFAVQLASSPSLPGLRKSWDQLVERHTALAALQPRVVPPRTEGGSYRLLAGPLPTKTEADRICTDMGVGRNACFTTSYIGQPL